MEAFIQYEADGIAHIGLYAKYDINQFSELTIDYKLFDDNVNRLIKCNCGSGKKYIQFL